MAPGEQGLSLPPFPSRFRRDSSDPSTAEAQQAGFSPPHPEQKRTKAVQQNVCKIQVKQPREPDLITPPHPQESILLPLQAGILHSHTKIFQSTFRNSQEPSANFSQDPTPWEKLWFCRLDEG